MNKLNVPTWSAPSSHPLERPLQWGRGYLWQCDHIPTGRVNNFQAVDVCKFITRWECNIFEYARKVVEIYGWCAATSKMVHFPQLSPVSLQENWLEADFNVMLIFNNAIRTPQLIMTIIRKLFTTVEIILIHLTFNILHIHIMHLCFRLGFVRKRCNSEKHQ